MLKTLLTVMGLLALAPAPVPAQPADPDSIPAVLAVYREEVKPGRMAAHERLTASYAVAFAKAAPEMYWLGLTPVTGDSNVVLYLEAFPSFAAAEAQRQKIEEAFAQNAAWRTELERLDSQSGDIAGSQRAMHLVLRPALSYRVAKMSDIAKSRYMSVTTIRVKPGHVPDFIDYIKTLNVARDKANASWVSAAVYQVTTGGPAGTFLVFNIHRSMSEMDEAVAKADERQKAIDGALGGDQVVKMRRDLVAEILVEPPVTNLFAVSRSESRPSPTFAAADPGFWSPQPPAVKALAVKKQSPAPKP